ncbi:MAG: hypothetical protein RSG86_06680, partial [Oscillospiraceae bacterium]
VMSAAFLVAVFFFQPFFSLVPFTWAMVFALVPLFLWSLLCLYLLRKAMAWGAQCRKNKQP